MIEKYNEAYESIVRAVYDNYPFFDKKELDNFKRLVDLFNLKISSIRTDEDFFKLLNTFFKKIGNSHTRLGKYPGRRYYKPLNYVVKEQDDKYYLLYRNNPLGEIISVDGVPPKKIHQFAQRLVPGASNYVNAVTLPWVLTSSSKKPAIVKLDRDNQKQTLKIIRSKIIEPNRKDQIGYRLINKEICYIKLGTFTYDDQDSKEINEFLSKSKAAGINKLILDLRGNLGGNSRTAEKITQRLIDKKIKAGSVAYRDGISDPLKIRAQSREIEPQAPSLKFKTVVIVDSYCLSSCEIFISGLKYNGLAYLIGEKTGGGSGNPKKVTIPFGDKDFDIYISTWRFYHNNGTELESRGINPDLLVGNDIFKKQDVQLRAAINFLK